MLKIDSIHDMDEYLALLEDAATIYIDDARLTRATQDARYLADDLKALTSLELAIESGGDYTYVTPDNIIDCLLQMDVDLDSRFRNKKTDRYSLDLKKVVTPLIEKGVAVELLSAYREFRSFKTYASFLQTLSSQKIVHRTRPDGSLILKYGTEVIPRDNLRVYYSNIAVVSIPKRFSDIVTTKGEGYHLAWCDYPQADWRFAYNLFIKDEQNAEQMRRCDDAYEGLARMVEGDKFNPEVFESTRKQYKVNCLSTFYNSRNNAPIPTAMREFFMSCPRYKKYFYDLSLLYKFKLPIPCTSYFGFEQMLPEGRYPDAFISKGLNTPIQTFTSEVVMETVFGILNRFWELGYTKDDINVYYVRHDEPIFMFRDSIIKDAWVFKDCAEICIDGFNPIPLEFAFGDFYQQVDEALSLQIALQMNAHDDRLHRYEVGSKHSFQPVPSVEQLFVQLFPKLEDGDIVGHQVYYYIYKTGERRTIDCDEADPVDAIYATIVPIANELDNPAYILLRTEQLEFMDRIELGDDKEALLKAVKDYDSNAAMKF